MQESLRTRRVSELIKKELARVIAQEVNDPKVKDVIIIDVRVTKDLSLARVLFTSYDRERISSIQKGLQRSAPFMKRELIKALHLKKVPNLEFVIDDADNKVSKLDDLFSQINREPTPE